MTPVISAVFHLLAVARHSTTVSQNAKNTSRAKKVNSGWKKRPGNSAKHLELSLNRAAMNFTWLLMKQMRKNKII